MNSKINKTARFIDLGVIQYKEAWDYQTSLFEKILAVKAENRALAEQEQRTTDNFLLFCQHPNVYTLGKSGKQENLLVALEDLPAIEASYYHTNRGGDITFHGPGQLVGYPIVDLENFFTDIHQYMRLMEEAVIQTIKEFGIDGGRIKGMAGVWIDPDTTKARKICAMGVKSSRWVTMHGFALNVNTDLEYFKHIVPCGISDKAVTSIQQETGKAADMKLVEDLIKKNIAALFGMTLTEAGVLKTKEY